MYTAVRTDVHVEPAKLPVMGRPQSRRLAPAERREQLLDVLADLVLAEGFGAVTIDRVAREADIARTVVYAQFGNLEGLVHALVDRAGDRALAQLAALVPPAIPEDRDPDELLLERLQAFLEVVRADPRTWRLCLFPSEGAPRFARERISEGRRSVLALMTPLIEWGVARRGGPAELDTELLARTLLILGQDAARLVLAEPERYPPERLARYAATLVTALARA